MQEKTGSDGLKQPIKERCSWMRSEISPSPAGKIVECSTKPAGDPAWEPMNLFPLISG